LKLWRMLRNHPRLMRRMSSQLTKSELAGKSIQLPP
jgi:hypothetical protein